MSADDGGDLIPDRAGKVDTWEIDKMVVILLRQFKRPIATYDVKLSDAAMRSIGAAVAAGESIGADGAAARDALVKVVQESMERLQEWGLTFAASLGMDMTELNHLWETTADFLDVANEKVNAEVRISSGSALLALLGDYRHVDVLLQAIDHDLRVNGELDVDAAIARRALLHAAGVPDDADDPLARARAWVNSR